MGTNNKKKTELTLMDDFNTMINIPSDNFFLI